MQILPRNNETIFVASISKFLKHVGNLILLIGYHIPIVMKPFVHNILNKIYL